MNYADVLFQGKSGSLEILADKVMFRPNVASVQVEEGGTAAKPIARSWRWVAIDRVDVVAEKSNATVAAATRDSLGVEATEATDTTSNRVIKLKAKGQKAKAVSLIVPPAIFDDVLQNLESRLASHMRTEKSESDDPPPTSESSRMEVPKQIELSPISSSAHRGISSSAHESSSKHNRLSVSANDASRRRISTSGHDIISSRRRLSSSEQGAMKAPTSASKRLSGSKNVNGRRKSSHDVKPIALNKNPDSIARTKAQRRKRQSVQDSPGKNGTANDTSATSASPSKQSPSGKTPRDTMPALTKISSKKEKPQGKPSTPSQNGSKIDKVNLNYSNGSLENGNIMDEIQGLPLDVAIPNHKLDTKSTSQKVNITSSAMEALPKDDLNASSSSIRRKKTIKATQTNELERVAVESAESGKLTSQPRRSSKTSATKTTKAAITVKKRNSTGKSSGTKILNASSSSLRVEETKTTAAAAAASKNSSKGGKAGQARESNLSSSSLRLEEARKEAAQRLQNSHKDIVFTPEQESKPKLNINEFIGGFNDPQEMMDVFFTPPFQAKEKVSMGSPKRASLKDTTGIANKAEVTSAKRGRNVMPQKEASAVGSPSRHPQENLIRKDNGDCPDESSGDEYSDSETDEDKRCDDDSSTSELSAVPRSQHNPACDKPISPGKSPTKSTSGGSLLINPEAPENKFRMMALQHAATCQPSLNSGRGVCPYDPICGEYRKILDHVESCRDEECAMDKCRSTKQFLVTMQLLEKSRKDGIDMEGSSEQKDFLVGVGAVAPLSFVDVPQDPREGKFSDTCSAITEPTWIDEKEPIVDKKQNKGRGRGAVGKSRNRVVVDKSRGRVLPGATTGSTELEIM